MRIRRTGVPNKGVAKALKERHQQEAQVRLEQWRNLTPQQQLQSLDERLGAGRGAAKQRARIEELRK